MKICMLCMSFCVQMYIVCGSLVAQWLGQGAATPEVGGSSGSKKKATSTHQSYCGKVQPCEHPATNSPTMPQLSATDRSRLDFGCPRPQANVRGIVYVCVCVCIARLQEFACTSSRCLHSAQAEFAFAYIDNVYTPHHVRVCVCGKLTIHHTR